MKTSATLLALLCIAAFAQQKGTFTDTRDGKKYKTVKIGKQVWMAENLNYKTPEGSWCYDNEEPYCGKYGRLYGWNTAIKACPKGWHLSTEQEWKTLTATAGGANVAGTKLKATSEWAIYEDIPDGTDIFGFSALPGSLRTKDGKFLGLYHNGGWWTATKKDSNSAYNEYMNHWGTSVRSSEEDDDNNNLYEGHSVRCIRN